MCGNNKDDFGSGICMNVVIRSEPSATLCFFQKYHVKIHLMTTLSVPKCAISVVPLLHSYNLSKLKYVILLDGHVIIQFEMH